MKQTNLFALWKHGDDYSSKVYLIRVYYLNLDGISKTCLKLGFTSQPLKTRVTSFLRAMYKATGFKITKYEILSLLHTNKYSKLEYALHQKAEHLYFYNLTGIILSFPGSGEILRDTVTNINLLNTNYIGVGEFHFYNPRLDSKLYRQRSNLI